MDYHCLQEKIRESVTAYHRLERQVVQELLSDTSGDAMTSALDCFRSVLSGEAARPASVSAFAKLMPPGSLGKERLGEIASSRLLIEHFPAHRLKRIVEAAQKVLAKTEADSSGEEEVQTQSPRESQTLTGDQPLDVSKPAANNWVSGMPDRKIVLKILEFESRCHVRREMG